jgi:peptide chain release factor 1
MSSIIVEVHAAEGGADARDLVREQLGIYLRRCAKHGLVAELVEDRAGVVVVRIAGATAAELFADEPGGHRWQRVPRTERRGRVQTSTITVAVLPEPADTEVNIEQKDLEWTACRGSGAGGQHRNVTDSAVQLKHLPTGLMVRCESERSQHQNRQTALALLRAKLWESRRAAVDAQRAGDRRAQVGVGARGDKRRTVRTQDEQVVDYVTGRRWRLRDYLRGDW